MSDTTGNTAPFFLAKNAKNIGKKGIPIILVRISSEPESEIKRVINTPETRKEIVKFFTGSTKEAFLWLKAMDGRVFFVTIKIEDDWDGLNGSFIPYIVGAEFAESIPLIEKLSFEDIMSDTQESTTLTPLVSQKEAVEIGKDKHVFLLKTNAENGKAIKAGIKSKEVRVELCALDYNFKITDNFRLWLQAENGDEIHAEVIIDTDAEDFMVKKIVIIDPPTDATKEDSCYFSLDGKPLSFDMAWADAIASRQG